ncbi:ABC-type transport system involved in multi-copper enzyme maturation permease subunit [Citricoccus muralis]|uniref:ABC-type transport system involved in multi-copper enzyme maturation permease subunit n=2 Tax=Citricoccus muralis TaxID=169134 RepID=A0A3D9LFA2_9MICC|nr:ABC-type transport system involved in multi-copper enzyme maturation permease subunit [Citricoccus muralis]
MMTMDTKPQEPTARSEGRLGWGAALGNVIQMELRQRLRTRSWYIMLAVWFVVIGLVTWGAVASYNTLAGDDLFFGPGRFVFEAVVGFVIFFGLLVAPAMSASTVSGDRAGGTLAIVQVTLATPGQLLTGKWLASWIAALGFLVAALPYIILAVVLGGLDVPGLVVFVLMVAVELGIICALGTAVSAIVSRTLFAVVATYLLVALFSLGTLIGFALTAPLTMTTVPANQAVYPDEEPLYLEGADPGADGWGPVRCTGPMVPQETLDTRSTYWMLAANPFVVVADAVPHPEKPPYDPDDPETWAPDGIMTSISTGVRYLQQPPETNVECANGQLTDQDQQDEDSEGTPVWPLGLGIQVAVAAALFAWGRQRLVAPAVRLPRGTRVA